MSNCNRFRINHKLKKDLGKLADPCDPSTWITGISTLSGGTKGRIHQIAIKGFDNFYILKEQAITKAANIEKQVLKLLSTDMLIGNSPILFPYLYLDYVCNNSLYFVQQPAQITLLEALQQKRSVEWWAAVIYQLAQAIYTLEEHQINHNDLTLENIMFQNLSDNHDDIALMVIDFGTVVIGNKTHNNYPKFTIGRDLNYFLYMLIYDGVNKGYFPKKLADELHPFLIWKNIPKQNGETEYLYGLRRTNIDRNNWMSSGKHIARWTAKFYPHVTDRCSLERLDKLYGTGIGAVVGDALGMPIEFDYTSQVIVKSMHRSGKFEGLLSAFDVPAGTFTDDTQMSLALIDAIMAESRQVVPSAVAREFKRWVDSEPLDVGTHTGLVFSMMSDDGSDWLDAVETAFAEKPDSAANGATMRTWPIPVVDHYKSIDDVVNDVITQAYTSHMNDDAVYAAVFVSCLIHKLINGFEYSVAKKDSLARVEDYISEELYNAIAYASKLKYSELKGGSGWIVHTMTVVMWSIERTDSFANALVRAANVRGDTDTNASITGAIAGAMYGYNQIPKKWLAAIDKPNEYNVWGGIQITTEVLKDRIATIAHC